MAKKDSPYFGDFIKMIEFSCQASECLQAFLKDFKNEKLDEQRLAMHEIEHGEDKIKHVMMERLMKEFVPPIDREDIVNLSHEMDNITDKIEDIIIRMYMYNIKAVREDTLAFSDVIVRCCQTLKQAMIEFPNFRKSKILAQKIIDVNTMESEGDDIYMKSMRNLYESESNPIQISIWSKLYDLFEECCDSCEHVADVLESIVMKNS